MEERNSSAISINWKAKTSSKKLDVNASSSKEARKSISSRTSSKSGWKNFFRIFKKSNSKKKYSTEEVVKKENDVNEVYLNDLDDALAMAISLPDKVQGKDVQVSIELKAITQQDVVESETSLKMAGETHSKTTFEGNIKIPSDTTIEQVANMPLYFVNAEKSLSCKGELSNKIETVIKPLDNNLPINVDKSMIVTNINLRVNLQNIDWKCKKSSDGNKLNYIFISNDKKQSKSSLKSKTDDIVEEISQTNVIYNEESKNIVKEILSQVIEKVETYDISTQYSSIMECVNKEIDVQKSLLLKKRIDSASECNISKVELLSRISEEKEEIDTCNSVISYSSEESLYPNSTSTHTKVSTLSITESEGSMYYLKAPTNTPNNQFPKYMIKYDNKIIKDKNESKKSLNQRQSVNKLNITPKSNLDLSNSNHKIYFDRKNKVLYQQVMHENIRADIDKTLELLETAKYKLLGYLDTTLDLVDFTKGYKCKYSQGVSPLDVVEGLKKKQMLPHKNCTRKFKDSEQFFLGETKNESLISFSAESLNIDRVPKLNTIQNIYNEDCQEFNNKCNGDIYTNKIGDVKYEALLKERYSANRFPINLTCDIVENDINIIIKELLNESNNIKKLVLECFDYQDNPVSVVNSMIDCVLEQVIPEQTLIVELDSPKMIQQPVYINYCLIDQMDYVDKTKTLLDVPKSDFKTVGNEKLNVVNTQPIEPSKGSITTVVSTNRSEVDINEESIITDGMPKCKFNQTTKSNLFEVKRDSKNQFCKSESFIIDRLPKLNTIQNIYNKDPERLNDNKCNDDVNDPLRENIKLEAILNERYSVDNTKKYEVVENDISVMIRDLLNESNSIKEFALECFNEQVDATSVVKTIIDCVLEQVVPEETSMPELDISKINYKPVCTNYGLFNEMINADKALLELPELEKFANNPANLPKYPITMKKIYQSRVDMYEEKVIEDVLPKLNSYHMFIKPEKMKLYEVESDSNKQFHKTTVIMPHCQKYKEHKSLPEVCIKKVNPSRKPIIFKNDDNLIQRLEKGTNFLKNIYSEIWSFNYDENLIDENESLICIHEMQSCETNKHNIEGNGNKQKLNIDNNQDNTREQENLNYNLEKYNKFDNNIETYKIHIENETNLPEHVLSSEECGSKIIYEMQEIQRNNFMKKYSQNINDNVLKIDSFIKIKHSFKEMSFSLPEMKEKYRTVCKLTNDLINSKCISESNVENKTLSQREDNFNNTGQYNYKFNNYLLASKSLESCVSKFSKHDNNNDIHVITIKIQNDKEFSNSDEKFKNNFDYHRSNTFLKQINSIDDFFNITTQIPKSTNNVIAIVQQSNNLPIKKSNSNNKKSKTKVQSKRSNIDEKHTNVGIASKRSSKINNPVSKRKNKPVLEHKETTTSIKDSYVDVGVEKDNQNAPMNQDLYLLKKAAKILKQVEIKDQEQRMASEEVITYDLGPKITEQLSSYSTMRREREKKFQYSSSSSEEQCRPIRKAPPNSKYISQAGSYAISKKSNKPKCDNKKNEKLDDKEYLLYSTNPILTSSVSETSLFPSPPPSCTDYDADYEVSSYILPQFRYEYESRVDLNNQNEIDFIENNAAVNFELNSSQEILPDFENLLLCDSFESFDSMTLISESSLDIPDTYNKKN